MRVFVASTAILSVAAASGGPGGQGEVLARSLQTTILDHVRHVYRDYGRHLQEPTPVLYDGEPTDEETTPELIDWDWGSEMGGDFDICTIFDFLGGKLEADGLSCSCLATDSDMNLYCETNSNFKQEMLKSDCGSMMNPSIDMSISGMLSFGDDISTNSKVCATFGDDYECVEKLKNQKFCIEVGMTTMMPDSESLAPDEFDIDNFLKMDCNVEIKPNYDCQCDICDNFMGIEVTCGHKSDRSKILMDCTDGFSISDPTNEPAQGDDSGMSIIDGMERSFIVPQFLEQDSIAVTDSVDENNGGNAGTDTGDNNDGGNTGTGTDNGEDVGSGDTDSQDDGTDTTGDGSGAGNGGTDSIDDGTNGTDMTGDSSDAGVDATPAGDDSGGSFARTTFSLVASAVAFAFMSVA